MYYFKRSQSHPAPFCALVRVLLDVEDVSMTRRYSTSQQKLSRGSSWLIFPNLMTQHGAGADKLGVLAFLSLLSRQIHTNYVSPPCTLRVKFLSRVSFKIKTPRLPIRPFKTNQVFYLV
jgi:hypothetical protein